MSNEEYIALKEQGVPIPGEDDDPVLSAPVQTTSTTSFIEDGSVRASSMTAAVPAFSAVKTSMPVTTDIAAYMSKPQLMSTISWVTTDAANAAIYSVTSATILAKDVFARKVYGYRNVRGTIVVRLEHNADPFQQGRLLLHFLPLTKVQANYSHYVAAHNYNLTTKTQQPGVELDCRDSACELRIPYIAPTQWYDLQTGDSDWGTIYVSVITPLAVGSAGTTNVDVSMFVHFEDFEACAPVFPNAAGAQVSSRRIAKKDMRESGEASKMGSSISGALNSVASVASSLSAVPMLSTLTEPVAWAARLGSGLASAFGWAKPNTDSVSAPMIIRPFRTFANGEGASTAECMSVTANPKLEVMPGFAGCDLDEMSFNYLKGIPAYTHTFDWTTSSASDASLYQKKIGMKGLLVETSIVAGLYTNVVRTAAPFVILSEMFNSFRGGVVVTFKFVKTEYHSGRLSVTFTPSHSPTPAVPTNDQATYALREIIDIRDTTEVSFVIPYMLAQTYTSTDIGTMGTLDVRVLNELRAPAAAPTTISVNAYYRAADDFELLCPTNYELVPVTPQGGVEISDVIPHGHDTEEATLCKVIGNLPMPSYDLSTTATCASEAFSSIKQLISRYSRIYCLTGDDLATTSDFALYPFFLSATSNLGAASPDVPRIWGDHLSLLSSAFALSRGGVRFAFTTTAAVRASFTTFHVPLLSKYAITTSITHYTSPLATTNVRVPGATSFGGPYAIFNDITDGVEILVPHQTTAPVRPNIYLDNDTESLLNAPVPGVTDMYLGCITSANTANLQIYRSAADDYQLGYFIGFPALLYSHRLT